MGMCVLIRLYIFLLQVSVPSYFVIVSSSRLIFLCCCNKDFFLLSNKLLQCFDAVGWVAGRASGL